MSDEQTKREIAGLQNTVHQLVQDLASYFKKEPEAVEATPENTGEQVVAEFTIEEGVSTEVTDTHSLEALSQQAGMLSEEPVKYTNDSLFITAFVKFRTMANQLNGSNLVRSGYYVLGFRNILIINEANGLIGTHVYFRSEAAARHALGKLSRSELNVLFGATEVLK